MSSKHLKPLVFKNSSLFTRVSTKSNNKLNNNLIMMKKVIPNCNKLINNPITSFGQVRSYTTTTNWLKKKEVLNTGNVGTSTLIPKHHLIDLNDYERWNAQQVKYVLTSDQSKGGAGLSTEKVEPFYEAGFNGSSLFNIVENIKKKDEYFATEKLQKNYANNNDTCETIVYWVNTNLIPLIALQEFPKFNNEAIKQARTDPKYEYLRNLHDTNKMIELERLIGSNIELPVLDNLGSEYVPKDYNPESKYLFTRQRFEILKKAINRKEEGYVLSGPFGISKSYTMYLIACYAIVNSIPLLYVPRCLIWVGRYFEQKELGANEYLRNLLFFYNGDIFPQIMQRELITSSTNVIETLKAHCGRNVFLLFDEHNELFRHYADGKLYSDLTYFRNFTRWTGVTSDTMTIYCGSAHSLFEDNLPGGGRSKLIRITPPTEEEFKILIEDFGLNVLDEKKIVYATGRIPRELKKFVDFLGDNTTVTDDTVNLFINDTVDEYKQRLSRFVNELGPENLEMFYKTLEDLFTLGLFDGRPSSIPGVIYDKGLLYKTHQGLLYCINEAAKRVLFSLYCRSQKQLIIPKNSLNSGYLLEKYLLMQEYNLMTINTPQRFKMVHSNYSDYSNIISHSINTHQSLDLKDLSTLNKENYLIGTTVLFVPESEQFPSIDYLIVQYEKNMINLYLKQSTVSKIDVHYSGKLYTDLEKLLNRNYIIEHQNQATQPIKYIFDSDYRFSLLELFIHGVIGNFGDFTKTTYTKKDEKENKQSYHATVVKRNLNLNFKSTNNKLNSKLVVGDLEINWYYIYESSVLSTEQSVKCVKEKGVLYRNREDIEDGMEIFFEN
ncbi:hypothetical protein ABK040_010954 [Willaertia magna]